jgi:glycosyltransferase involved in cell wall biosynthesis
MRIGICTPDLASGDAVGNDVIGMYHAFTGIGCEARVFAANASIKQPIVYRMEQIKGFLKDQRDILMYHHSVGWDLGIDLLTKLKCRKVIKYHNVTPPEFFEGIADNYCTACILGRRQLQQLIAAKADLYLTDSEYNMNELIGLGSDGLRFRVVPPFHHIDRLQRLDVDQNLINRFDDGKINFLMVGRIVPNKDYAALIDAFYVYHRRYNSDSRLLLVGREDPGLVAYTAKLHEKVRYLSMDDSVLFVGGVSDSELKAYYSVADIFMITSQHEGFCVPLVEAMSMKIPIIAYASTAIPGTVGRAGIVWNEHDPELLAASADMIVNDPQVRGWLGEMGLRRYRQRFTNEKIKEQLFEAFGKSGLLNSACVL